MLIEDFPVSLQACKQFKNSTFIHSHKNAALRNTRVPTTTWILIYPFSRYLKEFATKVPSNETQDIWRQTSVIVVADYLTQGSWPITQIVQVFSHIWLQFGFNKEITSSVMQRPIPACLFLSAGLCLQHFWDSARKGIFGGYRQEFVRATRPRVPEDLC